MSESVIARRYAKALFAVERRAGGKALEKTAQDLQGLAEAVMQDNKLAVLYKNPLFSADEKFIVTERLLSGMQAGQNVMHFCLLLAQHARLVLLPRIAVAFRSMLDEETGLVRGELVTAVALDETKRRSVLEQLEQQTKRSLSLKYSVDPSILGGVVLKVGDNVLDASLRAQLSILKANIKRGEPGHAN